MGCFGGRHVCVPGIRQLVKARVGLVGRAWVSAARGGLAVSQGKAERRPGARIARDKAASGSPMNEAGVEQDGKALRQNQDGQSRWRMGRAGGQRLGE